MALGLELAPAAAIGFRDLHARENVLARDQLMVGDDAPVLDREDVQRPQELLAAEQERYGGAGTAPVAGARRARGQILEVQPFDQRQCVRAIGVVHWPVRNERQQARPENPLQIGRHGPESRMHVPHYGEIDIIARHMQLRSLNIGCFGGGTGLPSLLGGLKTNPWLNLNAVVTMFDSGGSSGQLRDELGVLPPGDVLRCALALARNEREARRVLLARLAIPEHARLGGHTGGNLLLSMMERYSGDFLAAVDGLRSLLGVRGHVWPVSVEPASICAAYGDGTETRGEVEVDAGQSAGHQIGRLWLEPPVKLHPAAEKAIQQFDAAIIGPGSFYTSLMPIFLVNGAPEAIQQMRGPVILVSNLLTEGRGMSHFTAGEAVRKIAALIGRSIDVVVINTSQPSDDTLKRYSAEHKRPLPIGEVPPDCEVVMADLWSGEIARHDRRRLAHAIWAVLARRLF